LLRVVHDFVEGDVIDVVLAGSTGTWRAPLWTVETSRPSRRSWAHPDLRREPESDLDDYRQILRT
jgi:hypothetical protein